MLAHAARELGYQVSQAGEHQTKAVVLRRDFNTTREQIHNGLVAAAMAELELLDLRTRRKADHLVAQADAEHRYLANKLLDLHVCLGYGIGIAGTVGEEHAVWVLGKNILCGGIPRHNGEVAAGTNQTFENAPLDAAIICDHTIRSATGRCGGKGKFMGDRQVRGVVCMRLGAAHRFDQVLANELRSGRQTIGKDIEVEFLGGNNAICEPWSRRC